MTSTPHTPAELLVAASHAEVSAEIGRWLVHDIRGPLQGVSLTLALVSEPDSPPLDAQLREALAGASHELEAIVALADRLLRLPRLQAPPGPAALSDALRDAVRFSDRRRIRVDIEWPAHDAVAVLPPVALDSDQLLHVLLAGLLFATRASGNTPGGRIAVTIGSGADRLDLTFSARAAPDRIAATAAEDDITIAGSRALLERAGGALTVTGSPEGAALTAALPVWRGSA